MLQLKEHFPSKKSILHHQFKSDNAQPNLLEKSKDEANREFCGPKVDSGPSPNFSSQSISEQIEKVSILQSTPERKDFSEADRITSKKPPPSPILHENDSRNGVEKVLSETSKDMPGMLLKDWRLPQGLVKWYEKKGITKLFNWQLECLTRSGVLEGKNLIFSAPTSAGKTLVADILMLKNVLDRRKKAMIILPFISVSREKLFALQNSLAGVRKVGGFIGTSNTVGGLEAVDIAICTIEKANNFINKMIQEKKLNQIGAVVVDELHMLGDPQRGVLLELLLSKLIYMSETKKMHIQIIGMSATLPNLNEVANWLKAELYITKFRPVPFVERIKIDDIIFKAPGLTDARPVPKFDLGMKVPSNPSFEIIFLALETILEGSAVLVFCHSKNNCENLSINTALLIDKILQKGGNKILVEQLKKVINLSATKDMLDQIFRSQPSAENTLKKTVPFGVAFHHAGLSVEERDIIEDGFRRGILKVLIATSTLSSGVNLPARRVIVQSPLFMKSMMDVLTYKQMVGRAGRQGIDSHGESILCCTSTEKNEGIKLVSGSLRQVTSSLEYEDGNGVSFLNLQRAILDGIASGMTVTDDSIIKFVTCSFAGSLKKFTQEAVIKCVDFLKKSDFVFCDNDGHYLPTKLGKAVLASGINPKDALYFVMDLQKARKAFVLQNNLHILFEITLCFSERNNIDWKKFFNVYNYLDPDTQDTATVIGIDPCYIQRRMLSDKSLKDKNHKTHVRFYYALALDELIKETPLKVVADKYGIPKGELQSIQAYASSFAGIVSVFCKNLGYEILELIISQYRDRIQFGVKRELIELLKIPCLTTELARELYSANITTLIQLAYCKFEDIEKILLNAPPFQTGNNPASQKIYNPQMSQYFSIREVAELAVKQARETLEAHMGSNLLEPTRIESVPIQEKLIRTSSIKRKRRRTSSSPRPAFFKQRLLATNKKSSLKKISNKLSYSSLKRKHLRAGSIHPCQGPPDFPIIPAPHPDKSELEDEVFTQEVQSFIFQPPSEHQLPHEDFNKNVPMYTAESQFSSALRTKSDSPPNISKVVNSDFSYSKVIAPSSENLIHISDDNLLEEHRAKCPQQDSSEFSRLSSPPSMVVSSHSQSPPSSGKRSRTEEEHKSPKVKLSKILFHSDDEKDRLFDENGNTFGNSRGARETTEESLGITPLERIEFNEKLLNVDSPKKVHLADKSPSQKSICFSPQSESVKLPKIVDVYDDVTMAGIIREMSMCEIFSFQVELKKLPPPRVSIGIIGRPVAKMDHFKGGLPLQGINDYCLKRVAICFGNSQIYRLEGEQVLSKFASRIKELVETFQNPMKIIVYDLYPIYKVFRKCFGIAKKALNDIVWFDLGIAKWLLDPDAYHYDQCSSLLKEYTLPSQFNMISDKLCFCAYYSLPAYNALITELKNIDPEWITYVEKVETKVISIISESELIGMPVDRDYLLNLNNAAHEVVSNMKKKCEDIIGRSINFNSSWEISKILYKKLNLLSYCKHLKDSLDPKIFDSKKPKRLPDHLKSNKKILAILANYHEFPRLILLIRKIEKSIESAERILECAKDFPGQRSRVSGASSNWIATGRIQMDHPNLQQIPKEITFTFDNSDHKISVREAFRARDGYLILSSDFSQLELRILAHFSHDKLLIDALNSSNDVFKAIAGQIFDIKIEEVTDQQRSQAKQICYGIIYGMGVKALASNLGTDEHTAKTFREKFFSTFETLDKYTHTIKVQGSKDGFVTTLLNRRRIFYQNSDSSPGKMERQLLNTKIQGSAADIMRKALLKIEKEIQKRDLHVSLILQMHDEFIFEVKEMSFRYTAKLIAKCMERCAQELFVKIPVKVKIGKAWGSLKEIELSSSIDSKISG